LIYPIELEAVLVHIHGGGFVAMQSGSHQSYLCKWASELNMPIFSIDYRLAPDHPFPAALSDIYQVYAWLMVNMES